MRDEKTSFYKQSCLVLCAILRHSFQVNLSTMATSKAFLCILVVVLVAAVFVQTSDALLRNGKRDSMLLSKLNMKENERRGYGDYDLDSAIEEYLRSVIRGSKKFIMFSLV